MAEMTYEEALTEAKRRLNFVSNEKEFYGTNLVSETTEWLKTVIEALEKVEQLEKENAKMKSILNKFCAEFLCRECLFLDKENSQCTIYEFLL